MLAEGLWCEGRRGVRGGVFYATAAGLRRCSIRPSTPRRSTQFLLPQQCRPCHWLPPCCHTALLLLLSGD